MRYDSAMNPHYTVSEARNNLGRLIRLAIDGHEVVLTYYGVPAVRLMPVTGTSKDIPLDPLAVAAVLEFAKTPVGEP